MRPLCRDCQCYCIYCGICHKDFDYKDINDSCKDFVPEYSDEKNEENEVSDD